MSTFRKALKYNKPSRDIDEKIAFLNKELRKTGADEPLEEGITNTTAGVYSVVDETPAQEYVPPVFSEVPNSTGVLDSGWTQPMGGDGTVPDTFPKVWSDPGYLNNDFLFNSNTLDGVANRSIFDAPFNQKEGADGSSVGNMAGIIWYQGVHNTHWWTVDSNNIEKRGFSDSDDSPAAVAFRSYVSKITNDPRFNLPGVDGGPGWIVIKCWIDFSIFDSRIDAYWPTSDRTPKYQGVVAERTIDGSVRQLALSSHWMYVGESWNRATYKSAAATQTRPAYTTLISRNSLDDASYYAGNPNNYMGAILNTGKIATDALISKSKSWASRWKAAMDDTKSRRKKKEDEVIEPTKSKKGRTRIFGSPIKTSSKPPKDIGTPEKPTFWNKVTETVEDTIEELKQGVHPWAFDKKVPAYPFEIARSIIQNKPVVIEGDKIPQWQKDAYLDELDLDNVKVNSTPENYSDTNFYTDDKGKVHEHTAETLKEFPPNTHQHPGGKTWNDGTPKNHLSSAGETQSQIVIPEDGSEPYLRFEDHAYHNTKSTDTGEVPTKSQGLANFIDKVFDRIHRGGEQEAPNTGAMKDYPSSINGDVKKTFTIPYSELPPRIKEKIDQSGYKKDQASTLIKKDTKVAGNYTGKYSNRQLQPDGTYGYPKEGDKVNTGGTEGKDFIYQGGNWIPLAAKKKRNLVASYDSAGNVLSEETTWAKDQVAPPYPKKAPPGMINGWHPDIAPDAYKDQPSKPFISLEQKDIIRNHKLTAKERQEMMDIVDNINAYLAEHPYQLDYLRERYPAKDPHLAELNWKMDQMLEASEEYLDTQFPLNQTLFDKVKKITRKNIDLTDPKKFEEVKEPPKYVHLKKYDFDLPKLKETVVRHFKKPVQLKSWHRGHLTKP